MSAETKTTYPQSAAMFLLGETQRLTANIAGLIEELVKRDQEIAGLKSELEASKAKKQ